MSAEYLYDETGVAYQITKRTPKRVYYAWLDDVGYVERDHLEKYRITDYWSTRCLMTKDKLAEVRLKDKEWLARHPYYIEHSIAECRRQMQRTHPDRSGNVQMFHLWRKRYEQVRR